MTDHPPRLGRRQVLTTLGGSAAMAVGGVAGLAWKGGLGFTPLATPLPQGALLAATPECLDAHDKATVQFAEGPFYSPNTPEKEDFVERDYDGQVMQLSGRVFDTACRPVAGALVDFWHVDQNAVYDNSGFRYRGHQFTDDQGRYSLTTLHPSPYDLQGIWRTAHLHLKLQAWNADLLTTQLYFPRFAAENARDGGYMPELEVRVDRETPERIEMTYERPLRGGMVFS